jgi:hypothetical protein
VSQFIHRAISNIHEQGFITGKKRQVISWGLLAMEPSSWIEKECTPDGFEWKDPSKIRIGEIHRLLDHWRDRIDRGLEGLIWVPSCPLFQDEDRAPAHGRRLRQAITLPQDNSDEEVFILPQSDEIEQDEYGSNDDEHSYRSSQVRDPFDEAPMDTSNASHPQEYSSCKYCMLSFYLVLLIYSIYIAPSNIVGQHSAVPISYPHASISGQSLSNILSYTCTQYAKDPLGIAGPSSLHHVQQNKEGAIPRPYPAKGEWYIEVPQNQSK